MPLRPKSRRRVVVLAAVLLLIVAAAWGVWYKGRLAHQAEMAQRREIGIDAFRQGDHDSAVQHLAAVVNDQPAAQDYDAALAFAISRMKVPLPNNRHLAESRQRLGELVDLRPDDLEARQALLEVFTRTGFHQDAIAAADAILKDDPANPIALKALRDNRRLNGNLPGALEAAKKLNEAQPTDVAAQIVTLEIMREGGEGGAALLAHASRWYQRFPNDPRFEVVLAVAHDYAGDAAEAERLLSRAAAKPMPDARTARTITALLDNLQRYPESLTLLRRAAESGDDPQLLTLLAWRLWQAGLYGEAVAALADIDPLASSNPPAPTGLRALAKLELGESADADLAALAARPEPAARSWKEALQARFAQPPLPPAKQVEAYTAALRRDPTNPALLFWLGDGYATLDESALAVRALEAAADRAPGWAEPHLRLTQLHLDTNRLIPAAAAAEAALVRSHDDTNAWIQKVRVLHALWQQMPTESLERQLRETIEGIEQAHPDEPRVLAIRAELLRRDGNLDAARQLIEEAADRDDLLPSDRLALADVSRRADFGLGETLLSSQDSPLLLSERARRLAADGQVAAATRLLEQAVEANLANPDAAGYHLALANHLEAVGDLASAETWAALADAFPDDLTVQRAAVVAAGVRRDPALTRRVIDRLRQLTGPQGQRWRIEQARLLLNTPDEPDIRRASRLLKQVLDESPYLKEPRVLLASAFEQAGEQQTAVAYLAEAFDEDPMLGGDVGTELLRLHRDADRRAEARDLALRMGRESALTPGQRLNVAQTLATHGEPAAAVAVLRDADDLNRLDLAGRLLLARLLERRGELDAAAAIYDNLLANPEPPAKALLAAALFQLADDPEAARLTLARLDADHIRFVDRLLARAEFAAVTDDVDRARRLYVEAADVADEPADQLRIARQRAAFELRQDEYAAAIAATEIDADDPTLAAIATEAKLLRRADAGDDLASILAAVADEVAGRPDAAAWSAVASALRSADAATPSRTVRTKLDAVADQYLYVLPLQAWVAGLHQAAGDTAAAADRAQSALDARPADGRAAKLAATAALADSRYAAARRAARIWRDRLGDDPAAADSVIAKSQLRSDDINGALATIAPHWTRLSLNPERQPQAAAVAAEVMAAAGRVDEARKLLDPLVADDAGWRQIALDIAARSAPTNEAADWLDILEPPTDAAAAVAWWQLATRAPTADHLAAARQRLAALDDRDATTSGMLADLHSRVGEFAEAEAMYRETLRLAPSDHRAKNNLAFLLLEHSPEDSAKLGEADTLMKRVLRGHPRNPDYLDTAARLAAAMGRPTDAAEHFEQALAADAGLGLARLRQDTGDIAAAQRLLRRAEALPGASNPPPHLQRDLVALRDQ